MVDFDPTEGAGKPAPLVSRMVCRVGTANVPRSMGVYYLMSRLLGAMALARCPHVRGTQLPNAVKGRTAADDKVHHVPMLEP